MKRKKIVVWGVVVVMALVMIVRLGHHRMGGTFGASSQETAGKVSYYTCPMHPQVHQDHPGNCPICSMKLVPVYQNPPQPPFDKGGRAPTERGGIFISPERQQLIGVKTEVATKKSAVKEIRTVGRVAFDPDLSVAQQEFVEIVKHVPSLRAAARSRLKILGMSEAEIQELEKKGKVSSDLYLPGPGDSVWIYATLYQGEMDQVKPGMEAEIALSSGTMQPLTGVVRAVDPIVDPMTRSVRARIEVAKPNLGKGNLPEAGRQLRPNSFVNVVLKVDVGEALVIPKSAVIDTGTRHVVFVMQGDQNFQARDVKTGAEVGDEVVVLEGVSEGEKVGSGATFLVDSESSLKAAVSSPASTPTCPKGEAWDVGMAMCMPKVGQ